MNRWLGPILTLAVLAGITAVLIWNLEAPPPSVRAPAGPSYAGPADTESARPTAARTAAPFVEYPIGEADRHHMNIAAVWVPGVHLAGAASTSAAGAGPDVIHLEADIRAALENPNGFAGGEFVPYLTVRYTIQPKSGGPAITGTMQPMIARDGLHYGATVAMPGSGAYTLTYALEPPSTNGLGRHVDPASGVADWWPPFEVSFAWDYQPASGDPASGS